MLHAEECWQPEAATMATHVEESRAELKARLARHIEPPHTRASLRRPETREFSHEAYLAAVARCKEYIAAGDVMQVQIGQRICKQFADAPLSLYRALRTLNPSPYMYFYDFGEALRANTAAVTGLAHQIEARGATEARAVTSGLLRLGAVGLLALVTLAALLVGARFAFGLGALSISTGGP
jgi:hypothetical protein